MFYALFSFPYFVTDTALGDVPEMAEMRLEFNDAAKFALADDASAAEFKQSGDYGGLVAERISEDFWMPFANSGMFLLESLPLMLLGMALYRYGFFSGAFDRKKMIRWGWVWLDCWRGG